MKTYFHVDMDAFFVSVEELFDPSLKGKAVVVGGRPNERGVVSAASYEARKFGVHSALPLRTAYQRCPHAIFLEGQPARYREYSRKAAAIFSRFTPTVEMASIDEAYLDITGTHRLHGPPLEAAHKLHETMKRETGLNCSIGIATSRLAAKVASDQAKPNGILWVQPGLEAPFLAPLEVRKLPGVGKVTEKHLREYGIRRAGDLAAVDRDFLSRRFGAWGVSLAAKAAGEDAGGWYDAEIGSESDPKSISHEHTFDTDTAESARLEATLARLSQMVARRLREHSLFARTLQIKLRYSGFDTYTRAHTLDHATNIDAELIEHTKLLFHRAWNGSPVRLLGVYAGSLAGTEGQLNLLEEERSRRWRQALSAVDKIRDKYGDESVSLAGGLKGSYREKVHENPAVRKESEKREPGT